VASLPGWPTNFLATLSGGAMSRRGHMQRGGEGGKGKEREGEEEKKMKKRRADRKRKRIEKVEGKNEETMKKVIFHLFLF
jgi:hypothetical protein